MTSKPILVSARLRRPPPTGWSWMDRRFVREHAAHLPRDAVLLYFSLTAVADKHGLSFYGDGTLATLLRMTLPALIQARNELLDRDQQSSTLMRGSNLTATATRRRRGTCASRSRFAPAVTRSAYCTRAR